jgi:hypothetical protein
MSTHVSHAIRTLADSCPTAIHKLDVRNAMKCGDGLRFYWAMQACDCC